MNYIWYLCYKLQNTLHDVLMILKGNVWEFVPEDLTLPDIFLQTQYHTENLYAQSALAWLIVICTTITSTFAIILLRKQRKTQKMLRELNEKLDKLQPTSDPDELNTEDTESAE